MGRQKRMMTKHEVEHLDAVLVQERYYRSAFWLASKAPSWQLQLGLEAMQDIDWPDASDSIRGCAFSSLVYELKGNHERAIRLRIRSLRLIVKVLSIMPRHHKGIARLVETCRIERHDNVFHMKRLLGHKKDKSRERRIRAQIEQIDCLCNQLLASCEADQSVRRAAREVTFGKQGIRQWSAAPRKIIDRRGDRIEVKKGRKQGHSELT